MQRARSNDNAAEVKRRSTGKSRYFRQVERILFHDCVERSFVSGRRVRSRTGRPRTAARISIFEE